MSATAHDDHRVRDRFVAFAFAAADAVLEIAADGKVVYAAGAIESLTRRTTEALLGQPFASILAAGERDRTLALLADLGPGGRLSPALTHLDSGREIMLGACRLPDEGHASIFATLTQPIARPLAMAAREQDHDTGVLTRTAFAAAVAERMAEGAEGDSLALVELGGFDRLLASADGEHKRQLLSAIGDVLKQSAGQGGFAGRLGGERFSMLGPEPADERALSERLTRAARKLAPGAEPLDAKSVTIALETAGLSRADAGRAVLYAMHRFAQAELSVEGIAALGPGLPAMLADAAGAVGRLRETIRDHLITIALQPIVVLETGKVHHYEVLCRLPDGSSPAIVVAAAEQAALAPEFDLMVVEMTLAHLEDFAGKRPARVAINLSGRSIESPTFMRSLEALLDRRKLRPADILFEITETAAIGSLARATDLVGRLRARGHPICIDDLGAGAASFQYLGAFAVDYAKIDGRYVRNAATDHRDKAFLVAMIGLCRNLGIPVIAESVETAEQAKASQALGATLGQGYHFGRPVPIREVLDV